VDNSLRRLGTDYIDRAVSQQEVGGCAPAVRPARVLKKLDEHGSALKFFRTLKYRGWAPQRSGLTNAGTGAKKQMPQERAGGMQAGAT